MVLGGMFGTFSKLNERLLPVATRRQRRTWSGNGRAHVEVRGAHRAGVDVFLRHVESALEALEGVHWAEVNAVVGRVVVAFDGEQLGVDDLVAVVEGVEEAHDMHTDRFPLDRPEHPADAAPLRRHVLALGADVAGFGVSVFGRVLQATPIPVEVASIVSVVDSVPRLRHQLESRVGAPVADLGLALANAIAQALGQGPLGLAVDIAHRSLQIGEVQSRRRVWAEREPELHGRRSDEPADALVVGERPMGLPGGPIEMYADRAVLGSLGASAAVALVTRDPRRAGSALLAGMPKAGRLGREAFAARLDRALAARGVVVLDPAVLRRLDRVDTVLLDAMVLRKDAHQLGAVVALEFDAIEAQVRVHALFDPRKPGAKRRDGAWELAPLRGNDARLDAETVAIATSLRRDGAKVLGLCFDETVVALVQVVVALDPLASNLVAAGRAAGHLVAVADKRNALATRLGVDRVVPGGDRMIESVRALQADGRVVAFVSGSAREGLRAADCGVGVLGIDASPPWGADLLCGPGLAEAIFVVEATGTARAVSKRSAMLALYGSAAGELVTVAGPRRSASRRAALPVNGAAMAAIAAGAWSAATLARQPALQPPDVTPWHALPVDAALRELDTAATGLAAEEVERRRIAFGAVEETEKSPGLARASLDELANPLTPVLATGAGLSAVSGGVTDAALIGSVMGVNAVLGGVQRLGADRALRRLVDASEVKVRVRRDGEEMLTSADQLVRGDVVVLLAGDVVPADCRILDASALEVDESSLTGESQLVEKHADPSPTTVLAEQRSMLFEGSTVAAGTGVAVVVAIGASTEIGRTSAASRGRVHKGGVEERLRSLTAVTIPVALGSGAALVANGLLRGQPLRRTLAAGVGLAVAAVPEGLPFVATVAQLGAARRLSKRNALVRNPRTIETLGRVDVLCFDKTGTLTEGHIRLQRVSDGANDEALDSLAPARELVLAAALRASPHAADDGSLAHPTDQAIVLGAADAGVQQETGVGSWRVIDELPFEPVRGFHAVLGRSADGPRLSVKGAPEVVLSRCTQWRREDGVHPLGDADRALIDTSIDVLARQGYRVLVVAERAASGRADLDEDRVTRLELLGLVALADSVRPTAAAAVNGLRRAGVDVVMLTGDHPSTAEAIAVELDLLNGARVVTGPELDDLDDDALGALLPTVSVFARVTPAHKVRIVEALQRAGRVVAVTGDGANDAPAIHLADVGIALGRRGTNAAKEAADVVVTDDSIETIVDAIVEGRAMWTSVRDAIAVLLGGNLGEIVFTLGAGIVGGGSPLNARQLLLVNLLTDMLPAMAVALVPPRRTTPEELLREGPEASLGSALTRDVLIRAAATAGGAGGAWVVARATGTRGRAGTVALVALVGTQLGQTVIVGRGTPLVVGATVVSGAALAAIVQTPGVSHFFGCRPLGPVGWTTAIGASVISTGASVAAPWILHRILGPGPGGTSSSPTEPEAAPTETVAVDAPLLSAGP